MRILFLVNVIDELDPVQTTSMLIHRARAEGHEVHVAAVDGLGLTAADRVQAAARAVGPGSVEEMLAGLSAAAPTALTLEPGDLVWIRTNPARDQGRSWAHWAALDLLELASEWGIAVLNDPAGLRRASSKLYLTRFPAALRPETMISADVQALRAFVQGRPASVVKPLAGTWGQDVYRLHPDADNLLQILDALARRGMVIAQEYVSAAAEGDVRIVVVDGRLVRADDRVLAVRRRPGFGDFRSNIHAGGSPEAVAMDDVLLAVADAAGPQLRADGIFLAGLDVIGGKLIEINAFSPGGLYDAERFYGVDFATLIVRAACARAGHSVSSQ